MVASATTHHFGRSCWRRQERDAEPLHDPDQRAGLRLHTLDRGDDEHRAVEHSQRAFDLGDEVGVARGVDEVDLSEVARAR